MRYNLIDVFWYNTVKRLSLFYEYLFCSACYLYRRTRNFIVQPFFFLGRLFMFDIWFGSWSIRLMNKSSVEQQQLINQLFNAHVTWMIFILWYLHRQARNGFGKTKTYRMNLNKRTQVYQFQIRNQNLYFKTQQNLCGCLFVWYLVFRF